MTLTRRTLLKGTAAAGGALLVAKVGQGGLETLVAAKPEVQVQPADPVEDSVASACWVGKQDCGIVARRIDGRVVKIEGHPAHPRNLGRLCPKGMTQIVSLYDPARLKTPLIRTNEKGVPGQWRQASWDEVLKLTADRLKTAIAKDKRLAAFVPGRTKVGSINDTAFRAAVGIPNAYGRRGNDCGGALEDAVLATWGDRGVMMPDLRQTKLLICYWNLTQAGGPGLCSITLPREIAAAKERGLKIIAINPYGRSVAHFADEWVPIKPGTDLAFWLAVLNVLLAGGYVDAPFLRSFTNAGSLVKDDGTLLREGDKELVWDAKAKKAAPYGPDVTPSLAGEYTVGNTKVKPALERLRDQVASYTPDWAAKICDIPAAQIARIAHELGETASIGTNTSVEGVTVPLRPVAFGLHGTASKFHSSLQTNRAILLSFMLLGAIEAAGGPHFWNEKVDDPAKAQAGWLKAVANETPDRLDLGGTKWFPLGSSGYHMFPHTVLEPQKYNLPYRPEEMAVLVDYLNPILTARPTDKVLEAWKRFGFVAVVAPDLNATADYVADVVLPCGTLDKWEGPLNVRTLYDGADTVRVPLMGPLGEARGETEIYTDLAEQMGKLLGKDGFVDQVNKALGIKEKFLLPLDRKPTPEQIIGAWVGSKHGLSIEAIKKRGVVAWHLEAKDIYLSAGEKPFGGVRAHFFVEAFNTLKAEMRKRNVPESLWGHYGALPAWTTPIMDKSPAEYDLILLDFKRIEHKHTRTAANPLLKELAPTNPLVMNASAARRRRLKDGDAVWVESHNPVTGETRRVKTTVATTQSIRPDSVGLTHHVGRPDQPTVNALFAFGDGFWDMGGAWFSHIKVKVTKAEV